MIIKHAVYYFNSVVGFWLHEVVAAWERRAAVQRADKLQVLQDKNRRAIYGPHLTGWLLFYARLEPWYSFIIVSWCTASRSPLVWTVCVRGRRIVRALFSASLTRPSPGLLRRTRLGRTKKILSPGWETSLRYYLKLLCCVIYFFINPY